MRFTSSIPQSLPDPSLRRENLSDADGYLKKLRATRVIGYYDLEVKSIFERVKGCSTSGKVWVVIVPWFQFHPLMVLEIQLPFNRMMLAARDGAVDSWDTTLAM